MSQNTGITLDIDPCMKALMESNDAANALAFHGMREAAKQLKIDADDIPPRTPHLTGALRASGTSEANIENGEIVGTVKYSTPYAARWHETDEDIHWSESDVGPKYLESKVVNLGQKYLEMIAEKLKEKFG